jgi:hypothetical protein
MSTLPAQTIQEFLVYDSFSYQTGTMMIPISICVHRTIVAYIYVAGLTLLLAAAAAAQEPALSVNDKESPHTAESGVCVAQRRQIVVHVCDQCYAQFQIVEGRPFPDYRDSTQINLALCSRCRQPQWFFCTVHGEYFQRDRDWVPLESKSETRSETMTRCPECARPISRNAKGLLRYEAGGRAREQEQELMEEMQREQQRRAKQYELRRIRQRV